MFAFMCLVYDRRKADKESIMIRKTRTGEKSRQPETRREPPDEAAPDKRDKLPGKLAAPFNMDYISGRTSLKYTI